MWANFKFWSVCVPWRAQEWRKKLLFIRLSENIWQIKGLQRFWWQFWWKISKKIAVPNCPFYNDSAKLSIFTMLVPNLLFFILVPNCLFAFLVPNCPFLQSWCQIVWCQIVLQSIPVCSGWFFYWSPLKSVRLHVNLFKKF